MKIESTSKTIACITLFVFVMLMNHPTLRAQEALADGDKRGEVQSKSYETAPAASSFASYLVQVPDIQVNTVVGSLPRLPAYLDGKYLDGINGPKVRILWPAPKDNAEVRTPGSYTVTGKIVGSEIVPVARVTVLSDNQSSAPENALKAFDLSQVILNNNANGLPTKFIQNRDKFLIVLAQTNPDSFLYMFRDAFGQPQPEGAFPLGVWDSRDTKLRGHATGHYLSALAQAYAGSFHDSVLNTILKEKMKYTVGVLYNLSQLSGNPEKPEGPYQKEATEVPVGPGKSEYSSDLSAEGIRTDYWNWGTGFISAYPPDQFIMLEQGAKYGTGDDKIWAPYYTLHKILTGLMDVHEVSGNVQALDVVKGMADWVHARLSRLPSGTLIGMWDTYIAGEFGGMNEAMARLSGLTGDSKYLAVARLFDNITVFYGDANRSHGLAKNVDTFRGLHANQHIPQILGALELYRETAASDYFFVADNFWHKATTDYMYSIGGVAGAQNPTNPECFTAEPGTLFTNGFSGGGQNETCATYNLLKLSGNLFQFTPSADIMDYFERGLYNHILASVAQDSPANTYHVPLGPGAEKDFGNPEMKGFTCCNGTALESNTKFQGNIYFQKADGSALYVNLFIPSELQWTDKNVVLEQETNFPNADWTRLKIKGNATFDLLFRIPGWVERDVEVRINGKVKNGNFLPGTYANLGNTWQDGDVIEVKLPFGFRIELLMDQPEICSLFYGPILLAAQEEEKLDSWRSLKVNPNHLENGFQGHSESLEFSKDGLEFKPFYESYGRYSVYFRVVLAFSSE